MAEEKIFADGFLFKRNDNAPHFVVGSQSIKVEEAVAFLKANAKNGWVTLSIKQSKGGNYYCELDTWEPKKAGNTQPAAEAANADDLPF
jgi:hypothetical protein